MRVVIGEDETLLRAGLVLVLQQSGFEVVGEAADGDDVVELALRLRPELVVTDIRMPPTRTDEGVRATQRIKAELPACGVVVLSQHVQRRYAIELLADAATGLGYLLKQRVSDIAAFAADLRRVAAGAVMLDPEVVALMMSRSGRGGRGIESLTERQRDVLALMAEGMSNAAIGARLSLSDKAVVAHASRIYDELGLPVSEHDHRRVLAVIRWLDG